MKVSRYQLIGFGATKYQATELTRDCKVVGKEGRSNLYELLAIIQEIETRLKNKRLHKNTYLILKKLLEKLHELTTNVVTVPFGAATTETTPSVQKLLNSVNNSKTTKHKLNAANFRGKRLSHEQ